MIPSLHPVDVNEISKFSNIYGTHFLFNYCVIYMNVLVPLTYGIFLTYSKIP
jgi:hypothetical protein